MAPSAICNFQPVVGCYVDDNNIRQPPILETSSKYFQQSMDMVTLCIEVEGIQ